MLVKGGSNKTALNMAEETLTLERSKKEGGQDERFEKIVSALKKRNRTQEIVNDE